MEWHTEEPPRQIIKIQKHKEKPAMSPANRQPVLSPGREPSGDVGHGSESLEKVARARETATYQRWQAWETDQIDGHYINVFSFQ